jgi:5-methylcytosine-specific restriction endonuclease McrA
LHLPYNVARFFDLIFSIPRTTGGDLSQGVSVGLQITIDHGGLPSNIIIHGLCFYCARKFGKAEIDHFIPWSRYPRDLVHNLVLAHVECNSKKSDLLASEPHLERWLQRNSHHDTAIIKAGRTANIIVDGPATISVAAWAYSHAAQLGAGAWVSGNVVEPLTGRWRSLLNAQASQ